MQLELFVSNNYLNEHNSPYYECKECKQTYTKVNLELGQIDQIIEIKSVKIVPM